MIHNSLPSKKKRKYKENECFSRRLINIRSVIIIILAIITTTTMSRTTRLCRAFQCRVSLLRHPRGPISRFSSESTTTIWNPGCKRRFLYDHPKLFSSTSSTPPPNPYPDPRTTPHPGGGGSKQRQRPLSSSLTPPIFLSPLARSIQEIVQASCLASSMEVQGEEQSSNDTSNQAVVVHLILSVSGGCDSIALLHACMEWLQHQRQQQQQHEQLDKRYPNDLVLDGIPKVHVVHFHHRQRDEAADGDCRLVQDLAQAYGVPCRVEDWNNHQTLSSTENSNIDDNRDKGSVGGLASTSFSQDLARQWRRTRLLEYTKEQMKDDNNKKNRGRGERLRQMGLILTAHHREDSQESMMLKLLRGVHLLNLVGMEKVTQLSEDEVIDSNNHDTILLVRPFLEHSKQDLIRFLQERRLEWREDESNASNKYLRNRIRNELFPLLQDMTDGAFLDKRLPTLAQQSKDMAADIQPRVGAYLERHLMPLGDHTIGFSCECESNYAPDSSSSRLVRSEAIFQWICSQINKPSNESTSTSKKPQLDRKHDSLVSYDTLERILRQLDFFPDRLQWTLELGNGWNLERQGGVLKVVQAEPTAITSSVMTSWKWTISKAPTETTTAVKHGEKCVSVYIPNDLVSSDLAFMSTPLGHAANIIFESSRVSDDPSGEGRRDSSTRSLWFIPSWRNSPVKLRQFLRAQGIPLHLRDQVPILLMKVGDEHQIVAVHINGQWLVHKSFCAPALQPPEGSASIALDLCLGK